MTSTFVLTYCKVNLKISNLNPFYTKCCECYNPHDITKYFVYSGGGGGERWDDRSWNNRDYADGSREWDNTSSSSNTANNRYRDRSYEDDYEAEREDSDTESNHNSYTTTGNNVAPRKYRDSENNDNISPSSSEKRVNLTLNAAITTKSPAKTNKPLKKVDLGAAANFGRSGTQSPTPQTSNDLLNDDFNPRSIESQQTAANLSPEFGDFEKAFGGISETIKKDDDDFADFSSAFTNPPQQQQTAQINQQLLTSPPVNLNLGGVSQGSLLGPAPQGNLLGGIQSNLFGAPSSAQPPLMFAAAAPAAPALISPPQGNNNANDLLGGFSSLNIQPQQSFAPVGGNLSGSQSLLDGFETGE